MEVLFCTPLADTQQQRHEVNQRILNTGSIRTDSAHLLPHSEAVGGNEVVALHFPAMAPEAAWDRPPATTSHAQPAHQGACSLPPPPLCESALPYQVMATDCQSQHWRKAVSPPVKVYLAPTR